MMYKKLQDIEREINDVIFNSNTECLKQAYLEISEGFKSGIMYMAQYDENSDTGAEYVGKPMMRRQDECKAENIAPIT